MGLVMSDFTQVFDLTLPNGDGVITPVEYPTPLGDSSVSRIIVSFPPGCANLVGISILAAHSPAYPIGAGQFIIFDDYKYVQDVAGQIQTGQWSLLAYNQDYFQHVIQVVYQYDLIQYPAPLPQTAPISL